MTHEDYMRQALELARACLPDGDVPVGCVVVSPVGGGYRAWPQPPGGGGLRRRPCGDRGYYPGLQAPGQLAADRVCVVCHPGAMPHVRRGHSARPHPTGGLRRPRTRRAGPWGACAI